MKRTFMIQARIGHRPLISRALMVRFIDGARSGLSRRLDGGRTTCSWMLKIPD